MADLTILDLSEARHELSTVAMVAAPKARAYDAAAFTRLTEDWPTWTTSADLDLWTDIYRIRARARREAQNNPLASKAIKNFKKNVFGAKGMIMRAKVPMKKGKKLNKKLNDQIEQLFRQWSRPENCTVQGNMSWRFSQGFAGAQLYRDGECFIRRRIGNNKFNFALQFIDPDQLDTNYYLQQMPNGNSIRMGVEMDVDGRPVAYHFWDHHPAEWSISPKNRIRVPAEDVIHLYPMDRVMQSRGITAMASSLLTMHMLSGYSMAEVVAARLSAAKMGFFVKKSSDAEFTGTERDADRNIKMKASPGTMETLPEGIEFQPWDPQHPTSQFPAFAKMLQRLIGSGLDQSYENLANDREGVNYSSIRAGLLDDRDSWRDWQQYFIEMLCQRVIAWFLESIWLSGLLPADVVAEDLLDYIEWTGRAWAWIDPLKDNQAATEAHNAGRQTMTDQLAEQGLDFEDTMEQFAYEQGFIRQLGLNFNSDIKGDAKAQSDDGSDPDGDKTQKE